MHQLTITLKRQILEEDLASPERQTELGIDILNVAATDAQHQALEVLLQHRSDVETGESTKLLRRKAEEAVATGRNHQECVALARAELLTRDDQPVGELVGQKSDSTGGL